VYGGAGKGEWRAAKVSKSPRAIEDLGKITRHVLFYFYSENKKTL